MGMISYHGLCAQTAEFRWVVDGDNIRLKENPAYCLSVKESRSVVIDDGSLHLQRSTATHIIDTYTYGAPFTHIPMCPEGVAWAAMSYAGPRTTDFPPLRRQWCPGTRSGTEPPSPEGVAWAALSYAGPRTSPLFGGNGVCGTRSGTDFPPPSTQRHHAQCCTDHYPHTVMVAGVERLQGLLVLPVETNTP